MARLNPGDDRLTGPQFAALHAALVDAFGDTGSMDLMLRARLGFALATVAALPNPTPAVMMDVIGAAEDNGWTAELVLGARASRPNNARLLAFAQQVALATASPGGHELELRISEANGMLDVTQWRQGLGRAESAVCRIELDQPGGVPDARGTGFLVGSDTVMTNYHVMERVLKDTSLAPRIAVRFDFHRNVDGVSINPGVVHRLAAADWDVDHSPYSDLDTKVNPPGSPKQDELDYAVIRLDQPAGDLPLSGGNGAEVGAPARGWLDLPTEAHDFTARPALFILQHPDGRPVELAIDTNAVTALVPAADPVRVRYRTNTEPGSSGSPCFDANWQLIALHHAGDPRYEKFGAKPEYNEGIPIAAIRALMSQRGTLARIGRQDP